MWSLRIQEENIKWNERKKTLKTVHSTYKVMGIFFGFYGNILRILPDKVKRRSHPEEIRLEFSIPERWDRKIFVHVKFLKIGH